jgi:hypothetical protein
MHARTHKSFANLREFYEYYLGEHGNRTCAWVGHFFFERNAPATFRHPLRSLACDFLMFRDMLAGRIPL